MGGILLPRGEIEERIAQVIPDETTAIVVYCAIGHRSAIAADTLQELGYTNVGCPWKADWKPMTVSRRP